MKLFNCCLILFLFPVIINNPSKVQALVNSGLVKSIEYNGPSKYLHWGVYHKTPIDQFGPAEWINKDIIRVGWDWSLPAFVKPAPKSKVTNFEISYPEIHKSYLKFIKAFSIRGIPHMEEVKGLFQGFASPTDNHIYKI